MTIVALVVSFAPLMPGIPIAPGPGDRTRDTLMRDVDFINW